MANLESIAKSGISLIGCATYATATVVLGHVSYDLFKSSPENCNNFLWFTGAAISFLPMTLASAYVSIKLGRSAFSNTQNE